MFKPHRAIIRVLAPAVVALLTMSLFANARAADDTEDARSITLQYLSRDLNTPQGVSILYRRIRAAATRVCVPFESRALDRKVLWDQCFNDAMANCRSRSAQRDVERLSWAVHPRLEATTSRSSGIPRGLTLVRASINSNGVRAG